MEDIKILELYHRRSEQAIVETEKKYGSRCRRAAFDILALREDAEECVADTWLALWRTIPPQCPLSFPAYIFRILRNFCLGRLQERLARKRGGGEAELALSELEACIPSAQSPQRELEAKELAAELNRFLHTLSRDERLIFTGRYFLLLPGAEIAKRLGFSESKVRTSLHRSRKKLWQHLREEGLV